MKNKSIMLAAAFAMTTSAFAQSTTTTANPAATNSNTATADTSAASGAYSPVLVKYVGYAFGPGLEFSGTQKDGSIYGTQHRISIGGRFNANTEFGLQTRTNIDFGSGQSMKATASDFRLFANFKNVYKDDVFGLTLTPRILLPTSNGSRNKKVAPSPDMIVELTAAPKDSKFSFDSGLEYIQYFHTDGATGDDYTGATTAVFAPWTEVDYQLTDKTQLMVSYWPIANAHARQNAKMTTAASAGGSHEIDIGGYYEFVKGWQLNPYVAMEPNDFDSSAAGKNMQINLIVSGTIL